jgi:hypothetical protein
LTDVYFVKYQYSRQRPIVREGAPMYLTAFLTEELGQINRQEHMAAATRSRLARLVDHGRHERGNAGSVVDRLVLAFRPTPQPCTQSC